jgi:3-hydroxy-D-aspartate aldolase
MQVKDYLTRQGFPPKEISGGGTGTYDITGNHTPWTEIQAGSYIFMDTEYANLGLQFQNSLTVLATVIHKRSGVAITDAGVKVCSTDGGAPVLKGYPHLQVIANEEHGIIHDKHDELYYRQKVEYLPSHCCTTVNLHDQYVGVRNGRLEVIWPISARGKSQ